MQRGPRQIVATFCGSCSAHCVDILAAVSPSIRLSVSKSISQSVHQSVNHCVSQRRLRFILPPADKIAAYFAIKSLNLFQNKRELRLGLRGLERGGRREEGAERKLEIRMRREEAGGWLKLWVFGGRGGRVEPSYLRCLRLAALGCLRFLSGKEELAGSKGVCVYVYVCVEGGGAKSFVS